VQLRDLTRLLRAAGVPTVRLDGVEADSVIGALCTEPAGDALTLIVSSDHDFHQLVSDRVRVFDDVKKKLWDIAAVKVHYQLRDPREVSAYKALVGDISDGVKGVPRCGPVKARKVCTVLRRLDVEVFNQARAAFRTLAQAVDRLILIVGNDDQSPTNEREHALEAFKDFAMVVDTPQEIALGRATLAAFPFLRDAQEHRRLFKAYNRPSVDVVSTHVGVAGVPGRTFLIAEPVQRRHLATRAGGYEAQGRRAPPDQHGEGRPRRGVPGRAAADAVGGHGPLAHRLPWRCA
jgi:hypothetical protein